MDNVSMQPGTYRMHGVVAVIYRDGEFLMIRRSQTVSAPGAICFPGGGIEPGETEEEAVVRELEEELSIEGAQPVKRLWESVTRRRVHLVWWSVSLPTAVKLVPNPEEVAELFWWTPEQMDSCDELLESNREFLRWWRHQ